MKILIVSMPSLHTTRWLSQLKESNHEVYYFDILNGGYIKEWDWVVQHTNWRYKFGNFKGRYLIKKYVPRIHQLLENDVEKEFERLLRLIKPEVVHSFALHIGAAPILPIMTKHPKIKWVYSSWGSDLFSRKNNRKDLSVIKDVLPHINYLFTDCKRDFFIAKELGFKGKFVGVFPGGGGYNLKKMQSSISSEKKLIAVNGKGGKHGRAVMILQALEKVKNISEVQVLIFGAEAEVLKYINCPSRETRNLKIIEKMPQEKVFEVLGQSKIYIGNSRSDGMPNTMLEAIIMGAFPIQSNPGGATAEIIQHAKNGFLIEDTENPSEIAKLIEKAIENDDLQENARTYNDEKIIPFLAESYITEKVLSIYKDIETDYV